MSSQVHIPFNNKHCQGKRVTLNNINHIIMKNFTHNWTDPWRGNDHNTMSIKIAKNKQKKDNIKTALEAQKN